MTIKIEQEAMVRVLDAAIPAGPALPCHPHERLKPPSVGGCLRRSDAEPPTSPTSHVMSKSADVDLDRCPPDLLSLDSDEDCISLSSFGSASSFGGEATERRVSFSAPLVTEVKTRPRTKDCDKRLLFYTQSETDRFRQLYREERQSLSAYDVRNVNPPESPDKEPPSSEGSGRRRISRVVVEHQDTFETFYDFDEMSSFSVEEGGASTNDVFFDNDSFWSGSITWY